MSSAQPAAICSAVPLLLAAFASAGFAQPSPATGKAAGRSAITAQASEQKLVFPSPRRPRGIYALVNVEKAISQQQTATPPVTTPAQLNLYFNNLYQQLLADSSISGLALQVHWDTLNPNPPGAFDSYNWTYVDLAFYQALIWNIENFTKTPKTIQLIVTPGFQSPQWLLAELASCDPLFNGKTPPVDCGKVTFKGYQEEQDSTELPLPWNSVYKSAYKTFLTVLAARIGFDPALVSIAVTGPTAASAEIILPNNTNANNPQTQFDTNISPNDMWEMLFAFQFPTVATYQSSDQVFIDEWKNAIDLYGEIFSGLTLTIATGNGLPNFTTAAFAIPSPFGPACPDPDMDCYSEATILSHFIDPTVGGANAKATQTSGLEASRAVPDNPHNMGVAAVKELSQGTAQLTSPSAQILGGAQFNTSFSNDPVGEGCLSAFPPDSTDTTAQCKMDQQALNPPCNREGCQPTSCIPTACLAPGKTPPSGQFSNVPANDLIPPEQAEYNVLYVYFYTTPVASFFGGSNDSSPLNYMQIYSPDILYAEAQVNKPAQVMEIDGDFMSASAQGLLSLASQKLLQIAEPLLFPWPF